MKKIGLSFAALAFCLFFLSAVDFLLGALFLPHHNLVFPHSSTVKYETSEYNFTVQVNNLGFRGKPMKIRKKTDYRIVALGDSFTYGWGVEDEDTWVRKLEAMLREKGGLDVEVLNLGRGGADSRTYADIAEKSFALLKPDLVLVGFLQWDDLAQLIETQQDKKKPQRVKLKPSPKKGLRVFLYKIKMRLKRLLPKLYPNLDALIHKKEIARVKPKWIQIGSRFESHLKGVEKERYNKNISESIRRMLTEGNINPSLVAFFIKHPNGLQYGLDSGAPSTQKAVVQMTEDLIRIKKKATQVGAQVVALSIPVGVFVSERQGKFYQKEFGASWNDTYLKMNTMDKVLESVSASAEVPFYSATQHFREETQRRQLYFFYDSHFNAEGYDTLAKFVYPHVLKELKS